MKRGEITWISGNFIKTQKVNGVGVVQPQTVILSELLLKDTLTDQTAKIMPEEMDGTDKNRNRK
jgi:hypothetical protein